jgi:hypothetical protein
MDQWRYKEFCSGGVGSTNSVVETRQRERGSGGNLPLVKVPSQYENE